MKKDILEIGGNGIMYFLSFEQTEKIFQIISLILTILISLVIFIEKIFTWYKKAKSDGKITKEEIEELKDEIKKKEK